MVFKPILHFKVRAMRVFPIPINAGVDANPGPLGGNKSGIGNVGGYFSGGGRVYGSPGLSLALSKRLPCPDCESDRSQYSNRLVDDYSKSLHTLVVYALMLLGSVIFSYWQAKFGLNIHTQWVWVPVGFTGLGIFASGVYLSVQ
jgi:hypothetical protein